jgi:cytochrome c oxidase subunit 3
MTYAAFLLAIFQVPFLWNIASNWRRQPGAGNREPGAGGLDPEERISGSRLPVAGSRLGIWLFLASEAMLFGSLFSSYALLRTGAASWPDQGQIVHVTIAAGNTVLLVLSSLLIVSATGAARGDSFARFRRLMGASFGLGALFLVVKAIEYRMEIGDGLRPSTSNFAGLYFTMTGLHALHVLAGLLVNGWLWFGGEAMWRSARRRFVSRVRTAALYWNFIDAIWLIMFVVLYLL